MRKLLPMFDRYEPTTMDHTATQEFKRCPRRYFYRMVLGRTQPEGEWESVFAWGTAVHKFQEIIYSSDGDTLAAIQAAMALYKSPTKPKFAFQDKERLMLTLVKLDLLYKEEKSRGQIKTSAVEQPFKIVFKDGIVIGGRWDARITWNNRLWIRDWKTTSKQQSYFKTSTDPNDQAIRYIYAASALSFGVDENGYPNKVIDGMLFTAIYNAKTVGPDIYSVPSGRTIEQVRAWVDNQVHVHKMMQLCRDEDVWPMEETNCSFCPYQTVCTQSSESGMAYILKTQYILRPWKHEETEQKTQEE